MIKHIGTHTKVHGAAAVEAAIVEANKQVRTRVLKLLTGWD